jgi:hypothetical protein
LVTAAVNTRDDIDGGGGDHCDHSDKVVVEVNSLGKEKPKPNRSTVFLNIEGSWYTSPFFCSVFLIKSVATDTGSFKSYQSNGLILQRKFFRIPRPTWCPGHE